MQVRAEWKWKAGSCRRQTGCSTCKFSHQAAIGVHRHLPTTKLGGMWGASVLQLIRVALPKLPTPLADSLMGHVDATLEQDFLYVAVAQREAIREPDGSGTLALRIN